MNRLLTLVALLSLAIYANGKRNATFTGDEDEPCNQEIANLLAGLGPDGHCYAPNAGFFKYCTGQKGVRYQTPTTDGILRDRHVSKKNVCCVTCDVYDGCGAWSFLPSGNGGFCRLLKAGIAYDELDHPMIASGGIKGASLGIPDK